MAQVQIGTVLRNNDKRDAGAQIQVADVTVTHAIYYTTRKNKIRFDRIFDDGRTRAAGWSVVKS